MGKLKKFNLGRIIREFDTPFFFESGTWKGDGVAYAAGFPFKKIYSSEIFPEFANKAKERFKSDPRIEIIEGDSISVFKSHLQNINGNCIFWLDAHFPAADEGIRNFNEFEDEHIRLPLAEELHQIRMQRANYSDVILIDDLRIYEDGPFKSGNLPAFVLPPKSRNLNFLYESFNTSHVILKSYYEEGYVMVFPKEKFMQNKHGLSALIKNTTNRILKKIY